MDQANHLKLIKAGYTFLRADDSPLPRIKFKGNSHSEWSTLEKNFSSKAARDRRLKELWGANDMYLID